MNIKKLTAIVLTGALLLLTACSDSDSGSSKKSKKKDYYTIGETWTVDGQWSLTITGVTETTERNEYADEKPAAVYIVDYEYTNIGYEDEDGIAKGIFFDMEDTIIDSNGVMGYSYPGDVARNPNEAPIGSTCKAQACIGVDNAGDFRITESHYDSDGDEHSATFLIEVGGSSADEKSDSAAKPTETTTTTTAEATTTKPVTTLAPYDIYDDTVYANDLIYETADDIFAELGDDFSMDFISVGQENIIAVENDDVYPNTKIGFYTTDIQNIGTLDFPYAIHVTPGGYITEGVQVGMTYNELKAICPSLEGATLDGGTFGPTAWINIDGNAWGIEFDVSQADRERLGMAVGVAVDLSELNPKSTLGYYISSLS